MTLAERRKKPPQRQPPANERFEPPSLYQPEEPQESLVQIPGTPFFATPNEPADPRDCDRYPNSPWCGENPISLDNIVDIGVDLVLDECNIGIQLAPTLAFVSLPPVQLVYRREGCIKPPPPPPPPDENAENFPSIRQLNGRELIGYKSYFYNLLDANTEKPQDLDTQLFLEIEIIADLTQIEERLYPDKIDITGGATGIPNMKLTFQIQENWKANVAYAQDVWRNSPSFLEGIAFLGAAIPNLENRDNELSYSVKGELYLYISYPSMHVIKIEANNEQIARLATGSNNGTLKGILAGRYFRNGWTRIFESVGNFDPGSGFPLDFSKSRRVFGKGGRNDHIEIKKESMRTTWVEPNWKPTIPPPEPYKMSCCENNDRLLRLLLARVGQFPVTVPDSYLTIEGSEPKDKTINSLMELTGWFATRMDEVIGQFEIPIEIDDADLTKEGKQKKTIRLPNLSEAIAEIFTMTFKQTIYTDLMIHMLTDSLAESAQIKQIDFKNNHALMAIAEYMGFPYKTINQKLPLTFTPGAGTFEELLKETEIEVGVIDYQEKGSLLQHINTLLQAAAIIRAVHYRRAPKDEEGLKQQLREDLVGIAGNRVGSLREMIKEYMEDMNKQYDSTEDSKPTQ